jgi:hypothetical protein
MTQAQMYTQEQLDIALLKTTQASIFRVFKHIDKNIIDFKNDMNTVKSEMKSQFHLLLGLILGIYGMIAAAALGKVFGVL